MDIQKIKGVAFDLDGTIYLGNNLIDGAVDVIGFFRGLNKKICFFTNSSLRTRNQTIDKLNKLGVQVFREDEVYTSAYATAVYIKEEGIKNCFCIGTEGLIKELLDQGIKIVEEEGENEKIEAIIIGLDPEFNYIKLEKALNIHLQNNCRIIACNLDKSFPVENKRLKPGTGPIAAAIANVTEREVECIGKPNTFMLEMLSRRWNLNHDEILVIGDSLESDIKMAEKYRSPAILISEDKNYDLSDYQNNNIAVINEIRKIIGFFADT